jgi:hypothetical protein
MGWPGGLWPTSGPLAAPKGAGFLVAGRGLRNVTFTVTFQANRKYHKNLINFFIYTLDCLIFLLFFIFCLTWVENLLL